MISEYSTIVSKTNKLHIFAISLGLLIAIPTGAYLFFNSHIFSRASDEMPRDVVISDISKSGATVAWTTAKETQSVVEYGLSPEELILFIPELEPRNDHSVTLNLLNPSTTYYFHIRLGQNIYDNSGVPWTFTTNNINGTKQLEMVKGVNTKNASPSPELNTISCKESTDCDEIYRKLGRGCSAQDYFLCIQGVKTSTASAEVNSSISYTTPIPTPTSVLIISNLCKIQFIQAGSTCSTWRWDSMQKKPALCQEAFDRYILQCRNTSFTSSSTDFIRLFEGAFTDIASTSATLWTTPSSGSTVYCRVRAVDADGSDEGDSHATSWVYAEKRCD